ncbi:unnamed protein product [Thlaspi arvense]|uniref:FBD domain-containing protein n=1 Tax=Thlaspi arvense TaxID=13288 RepID=A0AAU9RC68_THLAR|nr:unnamed protein product [Thlaspi arvense]
MLKGQNSIFTDSALNQYQFASKVSSELNLVVCFSYCICRYMKSEPLPQFVNMSRLHVDLSVSDLKLFPTFLESFPNLKSLIVCSDDYRKPTEISFSSVPGCATEMNLVRCFLKNSAILKKLTLCLDSSYTKDEIFKKLIKTPRASTKCKVVIL